MNNEIESKPVKQGFLQRQREKISKIASGSLIGGIGVDTLMSMLPPEAEKLMEYLATYGIDIESVLAAQGDKTKIKDLSVKCSHALLPQVIKLFEYLNQKYDVPMCVMLYPEENAKGESTVAVSFCTVGENGVIDPKETIPFTGLAKYVMNETEQNKPSDHVA